MENAYNGTRSNGWESPVIKGAAQKWISYLKRRIESKTIIEEDNLRPTSGLDIELAMSADGHLLAVTKESDN